MTHAPRGGRRLYPTSRYAGEAVLPSRTVRDDLVNNALHAADEANAKVLVDWMAPDNTLVAGTPQLYVAGDLEVTDEWFRMCSYGPFGLSVFSGLVPYTIVCEVFAKSSTANPSYIGVEIARSIRPAPLELTSGVTWQEWTTSSTTAAWLSPTSGSNLIVPTPASWRDVARPTTDVLPGGTSRALASNAAAGATLLVCVAGMPNADYFATLTDGANSETVHVLSVSGGNVTLAEGIANGYVAGPTTITQITGEPREVLSCEFFVNVYGIGEVGVVEPQIHGMLVREYVGK